MMKSKLRSLATVAVVMIGLMAALSCSVFAAESPALSVSCNVDGSVTVKCTKDSGDYVFAAFYASNGQLLRCVSAADGPALIPPEDAAQFKAFLLNEESVPRLPAAELSLPASCCTVYTEKELQNVMDSETFLGAILGNDIALTESTITAGKTLTVPEGTTLTVSGTLNVCGSLINNGEIKNFGFIDVLEGELINGGSIEGNWHEDGAYFSSGLGIEGGAYVENNGTIRDGVSVADYYRKDGDAISEIVGELEITDSYIAVAFGTEPIRSCLASDKSYDFILACGTDPDALNTVELGGITVPAGKTLLLKDAVVGGEHRYENTYQISEGTTLTLNAGSALICLEGAALQNFGTLNVCGAWLNNGAVENFGFIDILGGQLLNGGSIEGCWHEDGAYFSSGLGIEGGAYVENNGTIRDGVSVGDYYREDGEAICEIVGELEITDSYIAVAFGEEPIRSCLASDKSYDFILACGADPDALNTVELGGITVPEGKTLLLKDAVIDGENTYESTFRISEGTVLTLGENTALICVGNSSIVIDGSIDNQGGYLEFGEFEVSGTGCAGNG